MHHGFGLKHHFWYQILALGRTKTLYKLHSIFPPSDGNQIPSSVAARPLSPLGLVADSFQSSRTSFSSLFRLTLTTFCHCLQENSSSQTSQWQLAWTVQISWGTTWELPNDKQKSIMPSLVLSFTVFCFFSGNWTHLLHTNFARMPPKCVIQGCKILKFLMYLLRTI